MRADDEIYISFGIGNTAEEASKEFDTNGDTFVTLTWDDLQALIDGKVLAWTVNLGEYATFIQLEEEDGV